MSVQTIAVVGAMEQEIELLRESMNNVKHVSFGKFSAYEGELAGKRMVLVLSGIGKVNAAVSTSWVIHQFAPDCVINTGSAGGLGKGLKVGDVVIGETVAHHFSMENGELTNTLKLKRPVIYKNYHDDIEKMYEE